MPSKARAAPDSWSPCAAVVPVRTLTPKQLRLLSARRGLGFSDRELERIRSYFLGQRRDPTDLELAALAQSWSEHCSYKSSRPFLRAAFSRLHPKERVLGTGDAGVMPLGKQLAYALRIESHNHPSAVEPYGGAATGIGGILRDVLAVGAKPIALTDPLFFGPLDLLPEKVPPGVKTPRYLFDGVVAGIRDYGNRVGVPTVSGGVYFDPGYTVNPLVNVGCVGLLPRSRLQKNRAARAGDRLVLVGGLTGRDGIGGVAFASQELTERSEEESRGAVQLGNPIMKEPLIHACLEAYNRGLIEGVKDLGGGGLATASGELVHAGGFGLRVDLEKVPLREPDLQPWEIWISESQERMILDVRPKDVPTVLAIFERFDVPASDIGEVIPGEREEVRYHGALAGQLKLSFRIEPPAPLRPTSKPTRPKLRTLPEPEEALGPLFEEMVLAPDSLSRESVIRVYDHDVQGRSVLRSLQGRVESPSHGDASVLRVDPELPLGLAITTAAQPWACRSDPRAGAAWVVEEAARNLYSIGARPDALSNCLNFGNPEDPAVLGAFAETVAGLAYAADEIGFCVPSGNVSFYNGGLGAAIPPTPVLLATGIVEDIHALASTDLKNAKNVLYLLGTSRPELGGSLYARRRGLDRVTVPPPHPSAVRANGDALRKAIAAKLVVSAHDVSDGGLAVTLAEMAFGGGFGFAVDLRATGLDVPGSALVAEGGSRWVLEVPTEREAAFRKSMADRPIVRLGSVTGRMEAGLGWGPTRWTAVPLPPLYDRWRTGLGSG